MEIRPGKGVLHWRVWGKFLNLEGNLTGRGTINKPTDYVPKSNSQQKSTPDTRICHQHVGAEQRGAGGIA